MSKGPIDGISHFVKDLIKDPGKTLKTTWSGVNHYGEMDSLDKFAAPVFGVTGLGMTFAGAAFGDPFAITLGTYGTLRGAGMFYEHGEKYSPGNESGGRKGPVEDGPPPPAPS